MANSHGLQQVQNGMPAARDCRQRSTNMLLRMWSEITSPICTGGFGRTASLQDACLASCTARLAPGRASQLLGAKRGVIPDHIQSQSQSQSHSPNANGARVSAVLRGEKPCFTALKPLCVLCAVHGVFSSELLVCAEKFSPPASGAGAAG